jgi:hypothetical protein
VANSCYRGVFGAWGQVRIVHCRQLHDPRGVDGPTVIDGDVLVEYDHPHVSRAPFDRPSRMDPAKGTNTAAIHAGDESIAAPTRSAETPS